ncbi:hypothetical protein DFJ67_4782 [Asanoa ferruginea]|uniref:Uncharacterized protein n=1 Tax=Asanoa ferruginea TaxID=53367 RepID=A0A3D9ZS03_9ACTN|nr:hypothetical protein [Asanoa ferruginea]REF98763.1 hypothetical protein DFJ67_4782 [Asanoa ferruginea]GIF49504.1 hypothetical protein Afe04nite_40430 [Asanoa ferruginea]
MRRTRVVILALGLVALLALLAGSIAWIVAGATGVLNSGVGAYIATGGLSVLSGYLLVSLVGHLRAGRRLSRRVARIRLRGSDAGVE